MPLPMLKSSSKAQHDALILTKENVVAACKNVDVTKLHADSTMNGEDLALFHRHEIQVGTLVGSGSFSEVYEVASFDCGDSNNTNKHNNNKRYRRKHGSITSSSKSSTAVSAITAMDPMLRQKRNQLLQEQQENTLDRCAGKSLQSRYVIKQLHSKLVSDPKLFRRAVKDMATEAKIMSQLTDHPHIAHLRATAIGGTGALESGKHDSYFLVLDRLVETLEDRILQWNAEKIQMGPSYYLDSATNEAKIDLKANYAWQIASALDFLHSHKILFRDLKPQNIGFKEVHPDHPERDVLALFDFGLSRTLPSPDKANEEGLFRMSMVGTRRYMAPEIVINRTYNEKVDTYSWGLVFFELVTQTRPFDGMQRGEHKQFICVQGKRPKLYSYYGLPQELEHVLRLAWAQDVSNRISMAQVCETLQTYLTGTIHENAVRTIDPVATNTRRAGRIPQDASVSSLLSGHTEQTVSTTNSFAFEEEEEEEDDTAAATLATSVNATTTMTMTAFNITTNGMVPSDADVSEAQADVAAAVPQIMVSAPDLHSPPEQDHDDLPMRKSLCERCTNLFRFSLHLFRYNR